MRLRPKPPGRKGVVTAALLLMSGCAQADRSATLSEIEANALARLGQTAAGGAADTIARILAEPLTREGVERIALLNNPELQLDYADLGVTEAELAKAGLLENPSFSAEILTGNGAVNPSYRLFQDFVSLVTLDARRRIAGEGFARAKLDLASRMLAVAAAARTAWFTLLADRQSAALFRQVVSSNEAAAELSQRQVRAGAGSIRDQAVRQVQYAQSVLDLEHMEAQVATDRENLNRLLGLFGEETAWRAADRLPDIPETIPSLDGLERAAIEHRLDLAGAKSELLAAGDTLELGRQLRWFQSFGLGLSVGRDPESGAWLKGPVVEFKLPVFDRGAGGVAALEARRERSGKAFAGLAANIRSEVRESYGRLVAAQSAANFYRTRLLPLHRTIVAENQRYYNGMLLGVYELLASRREEIAAARDFIGAAKDYWIARSDLEKALAGPVPEKGTSP